MGFEGKLIGKIAFAVKVFRFHFFNLCQQLIHKFIVLLLGKIRKTSHRMGAGSLGENVNRVCAGNHYGGMLFFSDVGRISAAVFQQHFLLRSTDSNHPGNTGIAAPGQLTAWILRIMGHRGNRCTVIIDQLFILQIDLVASAKSGHGGKIIDADGHIYLSALIGAGNGSDGNIIFPGSKGCSDPGAVSVGVLNQNFRGFIIGLPHIIQDFLFGHLQPQLVSGMVAVKKSAVAVMHIPSIVKVDYCLTGFMQLTGNLFRSFSRLSGWHDKLNILVD